jgi:chromosome partitioning protein
MEPKMLTGDAAGFLKITNQAILKKIKTKQLPYSKTGKNVFFGYGAAKEIFNFTFTSKVIAFQIVKGGVGKTAISHALAARASLYGAKVLCIDLDQQANLTKHFGINSNNLPVMIDVIKGNAKIENSLVEITDGIHLFPSRIDNAILDDHIMIESLRLDKVYKEHIDNLRDYYDLILIDCPPALGRSVAAAALASDCIFAPVTPDAQCLTGLDLLYDGLKSIKKKYSRLVPLKILMNKFDGRTVLSREILAKLLDHSIYRDCLLNTYIRQNQEFANFCAASISIFDSIKPSTAKEDIDFLTQETLDLFAKKPTQQENVSLVSIEATL